MIAQAVDVRQCGGVDRVVLEDQEGVEQAVLAGDAVDVVERHVLVFEGGRCGRPAIAASRSAVVVAGWRVARTGTVLISRPTMESAPGTSAGRPETVVPKATSCRPVRRAEQ